MDIKPIETVYKGYRFRSRLESRWAVFFDAMGEPWEYEPEGFQFSDGERYLPDFYMNNMDMFIEVKGVTPTHNEREKCRKLRGCSEKNVLLVVGTPAGYLFDRLKEKTDGILFCTDATTSGSGDGEWQFTFLYSKITGLVVCPKYDDFSRIGASDNICFTRGECGDRDKRIVIASQCNEVLSKDEVFDAAWRARHERFDRIDRLRNLETPDFCGKPIEERPATIGEISSALGLDIVSILRLESGNKGLYFLTARINGVDRTTMIGRFPLRLQDLRNKILFDLDVAIPERIPDWMSICSGIIKHATKAVM